MCELCKAEGKGIKQIELLLTVELDNGVKEIPFRAFSAPDNEGVHVCIDGHRAKFVAGIFKEILPQIMESIKATNNWAVKPDFVTSTVQ
ncbi:hypothetical protein [Herbiconiux daphne]|uniref:Uncharacterized protein n=1 Tax=Herbiconiux daphne TaxID=2970914 RepID=A0ABT2HBX5_9MICO|nr:hypothetical protein [Herbiconiux daphne]MCS5737449.1 hypothetical protein [Herbiconiux daphne]